MNLMACGKLMVRWMMNGIVGSNSWTQCTPTTTHANQKMRLGLILAQRLQAHSHCRALHKLGCYLHPVHRGSPQPSPDRGSSGTQLGLENGPVANGRGDGISSSPAIVTQPSPSDATCPAREKQARKMPSHLQDYVCFSARPQDPSLSLSANHPSPKVSSGKPYSIANYITYHKFSSSHRAYLTTIAKIVEPRFFHEAVKDSHWKDAMIKEIEALEKNNT